MILFYVILDRSIIYYAGDEKNVTVQLVRLATGFSLSLHLFWCAGCSYTFKVMYQASHVYCYLARNKPELCKKDDLFIVI